VGCSQGTALQYVQGIPKPKVLSKSVEPTNNGAKRPAVFAIVGGLSDLRNDIPIVLTDKPDYRTFAEVTWSKRFVECPKCNQCFQVDALVSKDEIEAAWWAQLNDSEDSGVSCAKQLQ